MNGHKPLRIGILGCSSFAARAIIPSLLKLKSVFEVIGVASREISKAEAYCSAFGIRAFGSYESLVLHKPLDAVYIPLPNSLHAEWISKCLEQDLHVLVEKSLACNLHDVRSLCWKASTKGLALLENFQFRYHSQFSKAKQVIASGEIGEPRGVRSYFGFPPFPDATNIRYQASLGGGSLLDAGAYPIKLSQDFLGPHATVAGATLAYDESSEVDVWGGGILTTPESPMFAQVAFGFDNAYQCSLEIWGSRGRFFTNRIFTAPPDYSPEFQIESRTGTRTLTLSPDNHYTNVLRYFGQIVNKPTLREVEYRANLKQAELIAEFREKANG